MDENTKTQGERSHAGLWSVQDTLTGHMYPMPNRQVAEAVVRLHGYCKVVNDWPDYMPKPGSPELIPNVLDQALLLTAQIREISQAIEVFHTAWGNNTPDPDKGENRGARSAAFFDTPGFQVLSAHRTELRRRLAALNFEPDLLAIQQIQDEKIRQRQQEAYESFQADMGEDR